MATSLAGRGAHPGHIRALLKELSGAQATVTVAGAGRSLPFAWQHGGKQGAVETPDIFNYMVEHALEPLVRSWVRFRF